MTITEPYVQRSARERDPHPWDVRRNRPDQTYDVIAKFATEREACVYVAGYRRGMREARP